MTVSLDDITAHITLLRDAIAEPSAGIYGPGSAGWLVGREAMLFLGAGSTALLQLAHPFVAHAIHRQSRTGSDPLDRFVGTFHYVYRVVFGTLDDASTAAQKVFRIHQRVNGPIDEDVGRFARGSRYDALDEDALFWVHATLERSSIDVFERLIRPLSREEKESYNRESSRFAGLFGIRPERLPTSWPAFEREYQRVVCSNEIAVGGPARAIGHAILHPTQRSLQGFARWYRIMTAGLLPSHLRDAYQLPFEARERRVFAASLRALRLLRRATPDTLSFVPAYHDAVWRMRGHTGRDPLASTLERGLRRGAELFRSI